MDAASDPPKAPSDGLDAAADGLRAIAGGSFCTIDGRCAACGSSAARARSMLAVHAKGDRPMPVVPDSRLGKIEFYEARLAPWAASAAAIGLSPSSVAALATATARARAAYQAAEAARAAAKAATQALHDAVRDLHSGPGAGQDMIDQVRLRAQSTSNPNVLALAQLPPRAAPGAAPPPGTSFGFGVTLLQSGAVALRWRCKNPAGTEGTMYEVRRKVELVGEGGAVVNNGSALHFVGTTGVRQFTDQTLPAGSAQVTYEVTAVRSTTRGNPGRFAVQFGTVMVGSEGEARVATLARAGQSAAA